MDIIVSTLNQPTLINKKVAVLHQDYCGYMNIQ